LKKELIIDSSSSSVEIALLEDGRLVELHQQRTNNNFSVGDVFLGRVQKLMPGLNAAFIDIGHKRDAFLHYTDLSPKLRSVLKFTEGSMNGNLQTHLLEKFKVEPDIFKGGKISQVLKKKQPILVQILKEPISTKGPRLSCELTLPGRYMVMTPFLDMVAVSKKVVNKEERKRLQTLAESIKPKNFGLIIRTAAIGKGVADLHEELLMLLDKWKTIYSQAFHAKPPVKLLSELDKTSSILRDILNDSFTKIVVNSRTMQQQITQFMEGAAPEKVKIIQLYKGNRPIFDAFGINRQIKGSFGKTSTMPSGAYVVIEHTEAMHVIDVNSGPKLIQGDQETSAIKVNLEAAQEIARQLRLRDIGGLIIVDFIDMRDRDHKQELYKTMKEFMSSDRAQHTVLPLSKFGLMQITRQRVRPELKINTEERCPTCNGTGKVQPTILLLEEIERDLQFILQSRPNISLNIHVHPYIEAYLKRGFWNQQKKWYMKYRKWIRIKVEDELNLTDYAFYDGNQDEIRLN